jgi:hypothetical protein
LRRRRLETTLRIVSPLLDLVLLIGDRVSRLLEPDDPDYVPPRTSDRGGSAPRGLRDQRAGSRARARARQ